MLRIATKTKLAPEKVISEAIDFFGPSGYKLKVIDQDDASINFEGGGGSIGITVCQEDSKNSVEFLSEEWDYQVKEFIKQIR